MSASSQKSELTISYSSLIRIIIVLLGVAFLYVISDILLILFLSIIISSGVDPWVAWFERHHLPRGFGVITIYSILFTLLSLIGIILAPALSFQAQNLIHQLPSYYEKIAEQWNLPQTPFSPSSGESLTALSDTISSLVGSVLPAIRGFLGGGVTLFLILVLTFYLSVEERGLKKFFRSIIPDGYQPYFSRMVNRVQEKIGMWVRGQLLLSLLIFLVTSLSLFIIHQVTGAIPYWLVLGLIAGVLEVLPFIGPFIAGSLAVLLVLGSSLPLAAVVAGVYLLVQQIENHVLVPKIMARTVGLNPIVVILVIIIGGRLGGVMGAIIAIPAAAALQVFLKDVLAKGKENRVQQEER